MKINPPWLCLITSDARSKRYEIVDLVFKAVSGGVNMVQLRTEIADPIELENLAISIRDITLGKSLLVINSDLELAIASNADGVHFKEKDVIPSNIRNEVKESFLIGKSVHSISRALSACENGADYLIAGTIYPSRSHLGGATNGPEFISEIISKVDIPVLGVGGIGRDNVIEVMREKASGIAVIGAITESDDPKVAASDLRYLMECHSKSGEENGNCS